MRALGKASCPCPDCLQGNSPRPEPGTKRDLEVEKERSQGPGCFPGARGVTGERTPKQGALRPGAGGPREPGPGSRPEGGVGREGLGRAGAERGAGRSRGRRSPEGALPDLGELLVLGDLVAEGTLHHVVLLGHAGRPCCHRDAPRPFRHVTLPFRHAHRPCRRPAMPPGTCSPAAAAMLSPPSPSRGARLGCSCRCPQHASATGPSPRREPPQRVPVSTPQRPQGSSSVHPRCYPCPSTRPGAASSPCCWWPESMSPCPLHA